MGGGTKRVMIDIEETAERGGKTRRQQERGLSTSPKRDDSRRRCWKRILEGEEKGRMNRRKITPSTAGEGGKKEDRVWLEASVSNGTWAH